MNEFSPIQDPAAARAFLQIVSETTRRRGQRYFAHGAVRQLRCVKPGVEYEATVQGTLSYTTQVIYEKGEWFSSCSCPVAEDCKHAVAVMLALLRHADEAGPVIAAESRGKPATLDAALKRPLNADE